MVDKNLEWACKVMNISPPNFKGVRTQDEANIILNEFKTLAKIKFRQKIKRNHPDKGGNIVMAQNLIDANNIVKNLRTRPINHNVSYFVFNGYDISVGSSTTSYYQWDYNG